MEIRIKELCLVDYITEEDMENERDGEFESVRTVIYYSEKETLLEAFQDYDNNFNVNHVVHCNDDFVGECVGFVKYLSVEEVN